jgi:hypothetical protein
MRERKVIVTVAAATHGSRLQPYPGLEKRCEIDPECAARRGP